MSLINGQALPWMCLIAAAAAAESQAWRACRRWPLITALQLSLSVLTTSCPCSGPSQPRLEQSLLCQSQLTFRQRRRWVGVCLQQQQTISCNLFVIMLARGSPWPFQLAGAPRK